MKLTVFYQVAALNDWRAIVLEQLLLLRTVGLMDAPTTITINGGTEDEIWLMTVAGCLLNNATIQRFDGPIQLGETPSILALESYSRANKGEAVLYLHTKGASTYNCELREKADIWRWTMQTEFVEKWEPALKELVDQKKFMAGWNFQDCDKPHFTGNFWLATTAYISSLPDFTRYQSQYRAPIAQTLNGRHPRFACEFWNGQKLQIKTNRIKSFGTRNIYCGHYFEHFRQYQPNFVRQQAFFNDLTTALNSGASIESIMSDLLNKVPTETETAEAQPAAAQAVAEKTTKTAKAAMAAEPKAAPAYETTGQKVALLNDLLFRHKSDKGAKHPAPNQKSGHNYADLYVGILPDRFEVQRVLEIGVQGGGSIQAWHEFYPNADLHGMDINHVNLNIPNFTFHRTDVSNPKQVEEFYRYLSQLRAENGQFDLVIDDGSHKNDDIHKAFRAFWNLVKPGGWFVIEDLCTDFWTSYQNADWPSVGYLVTQWYGQINNRGKTEFFDAAVPIQEVRLFQGAVAIQKRF